MTREIRLTGPLSQWTGYSRFCRAVLTTLHHAGFKVEARESDRLRMNGAVFTDGRMEVKWTSPRMKPLPDWQLEEVREAKKVRVSKTAPTLLIQLPPRLAFWHEYSDGPRLGWTMIESDRLNKDFKRGLYGADYLLAPSRYVHDTFKRENVPSSVCPLPVDPRLLDPGDIGVNRRNLPGFLFFSVFGTGPRKNWRMLMQAFAEEFVEDDSVGLVCKPGRKAEVAELAEWCRDLNKNIMVLDDKGMDDATLAAWYRAIDCYALPSAEGFGLPFVEAAYCGVPSVALNMGGAADVVSNETGYPVRSHMAPCIGQIPKFYTSDHRFPTCSIGDLKAKLREAYDDRASKGEAARQYALSHFTPEAIAPTLAEAVDRCVSAFNGNKGMWNGFSLVSQPSSLMAVQHKSPVWALCVGDGYGDAFASYGNALKVMEETGRESVGFVHWGFSEGVSDFLRRQPRVREVWQSIPSSKETFHEVADMAGATYAHQPNQYLPIILQGSAIDPSDVALTQVHWPWGSWPVHRPKTLVLTDEAHSWADQQRAELGEFILVQPFSTNSVDLDAHWPYWYRFLPWLIKRCESSHRLVFCGLNEIPGLRGPNVVDLIGKTPTMEHMLALADRAKGCVTTCNGLANYTAITGTRALVAANFAIAGKHMYYYRAIQTPNNKLMPVETTLAEMVEAAEKWLGKITK